MGAADDAVDLVDPVPLDQVAGTADGDVALLLRSGLGQGWAGRTTAAVASAARTASIRFMAFRITVGFTAGSKPVPGSLTVES